MEAHQRFHSDVKLSEGGWTRYPNIINFVHEDEKKGSEGYTWFSMIFQMLSTWWNWSILKEFWVKCLDMCRGNQHFLVVDLQELVTCDISSSKLRKISNKPPYVDHLPWETVGLPNMGLSENRIYPPFRPSISIYSIGLVMILIGFWEAHFQTNPWLPGDERIIVPSPFLDGRCTAGYKMRSIRTIH